MIERVILVAHDNGPRDDTASRILAERGVAVEWTCPAEGGSLPAPADGFDAALVYGGAESANAGNEKPHVRAEIDWIERWIAADKPYLGICLGGQLLASALGARVVPHPEGLHERGFVEIRPTEAGRGILPEAMHLYQAHWEGFEVPAGAELLAAGPTFPNQAFRHGARAYGFQFHPEVTTEIIVRWMDLDERKLSKPGVHPRERQIADSERYGRPMTDWLEGFLERWLAESA